jgi:hypothetical protein
MLETNKIIYKTYAHDQIKGNKWKNLGHRRKEINQNLSTPDQKIRGVT